MKIIAFKSRFNNVLSSIIIFDILMGGLVIFLLYVLPDVKDKLISGLYFGGIFVAFNILFFVYPAVIFVYGSKILFENNSVKCLMFRRVPSEIKYDEIEEYGFFKLYRKPFLYISCHKIPEADISINMLFKSFKNKKSNDILMLNCNEELIEFLKLKIPNVLPKFHQPKWR